MFKMVDKTLSMLSRWQKIQKCTNKNSRKEKMSNVKNTLDKINVGLATAEEKD